VLIAQGEQGSAKSTTVRVLRALVDPAVEALRALPKNERDLAIAAGNGWVLAFDNLSGIRDQLSDALCRLATGGGFATRILYTDDEEIIFSATRPIILNGIDDVATRGDLQERSLLVSLPSIPEERRVEEAEFWRNFEAAKPRIFGTLLDGVSASLRNAEAVRLERMPRMADFAVGATAMEGCFGWEAGSFVEAYAANRQEAVETLLANEPIADGIEKLLAREQAYYWSGTATELLEELAFFASDSTKRSRAWPQGPQALSRRLRRIAPALRAAGIHYTENEEGHNKKKVKTLWKTPVDEERAGKPKKRWRQNTESSYGPKPNPRARKSVSATPSSSTSIPQGSGASRTQERKANGRIYSRKIRKPSNKLWVTPPTSERSVRQRAMRRPGMTPASSSPFVERNASLHWRESPQKIDRTDREPSRSGKEPPQRRFDVAGCAVGAVGIYSSFV